MIRINLLPYRPARRLAMLQQIFIIWGVVAVVGILIAFGVDRYIVGIIDELTQTKQQNERTLATLDQRLGEVKDLEAKIQAVETRLQTIETLRKGREITVRLLDQMTIIIPEKVWLVSMTTKDTQLSLSGKAESSADVAQFMSRLKASPFIGSVELTQVTQVTEEGGMKLKQFSMTATIRQPVVAESSDPGAKTAKATKAAPGKK